MTSRVLLGDVALALSRHTTVPVAVSVHQDCQSWVLRLEMPCGPDGFDSAGELEAAADLGEFVDEQQVVAYARQYGIPEAKLRAFVGARSVSDRSNGHE